MKKMTFKRTIVAAWMTLLMTVAAHAGSVTIGYCNGEVASSTSIQMNGKAWIDCAIKVNANSLTSYSGNSITAVRAGLVARVNIDTLRVWVRSSLDGEDLATGFITRNEEPKIQKGWNEVTLETPLAITDDMGDVYVGYSLHQRANVQAVSVVGDAMNGTSFMRLGSDANWKDIGESGVLSIEAVVEGENIPTLDLGISDVVISPWPNGGKTAMQVQATMHNYGSQDVSGFTLKCSTDGVSPVSARLDTAIASTQTRKVKFIIRPSSETDENNTWTVSIATLNEGADERAANNTATATFAYQRNVLIEEFTTEKCVNCPRVAGYLHAVLEKPEYADCVYAICHHAGYYTDDYTLPCDEEYLWFYNEGGTYYAPSMMMDRQAYFYGMYATSNMTATFLPSSESELTEFIDYELAVTANVVVGITLEYNADSTAVTATVSGRRNANYLADNPQVCIFLTEDNIRSSTQSGADATWMHQHLTRAYNSTWGDPVEWDGNNFTNSATFSLNSSWDINNMHAVAFIYNYDSDDKTNCAVGNCAQVPLVGNEEPEETLTGDVNGDGEVTIADVNAVIDYILAGTYSATADVNSDNEVTIADVNAVIDIILAK